MKYKNYKCRRISKYHLDDIIISDAFKKHPPKDEKISKKFSDFINNRKLSPIIVDENYILVDGYCAYIVSDTLGYRGCRLKIYKAKGLDINKKKETTSSYS